MEYTAVVIATPTASERIAKTVKSGVAPSRLRASLMSLTTRGSVASPVAQGHEWIHSDGPGRGFVRCARCGCGLAASWSKGRSKSYGSKLRFAKARPEPDFR